MAHEERVVPALHEREFFFQEHLARYQLAGAVVAGRRVLDVACGTGYGSALLARAGAASVCAVDYSAEAIAHARAHHAHPRVAHVRADGHRLPFAPGSFDVIVSFETLEHLARPEELVASFRRLLAAGGVLLASAPNALVEDTANPYHLHDWSPDQLAAMLRASFPSVRLVPQFTIAGSAIATAPLADRTVVTRVPEPPPVEQAPYVLAVCGDGAIDLPPLAYAGGGRAELAWLEPLRRHVQTLEGGVVERDRDLAALRARLDAREAEREAERERLQADAATAAAQAEELQGVRAQLADARAALRGIEGSRAFGIVSRYWTAKARARALRDDVRARRDELVDRVRGMRRPAAAPPPAEPLVSVVVPVYQNVPYLPRMIESVLGQTYRKLELVLWDDCSPDPEVGRILARYAAADSRVKHFRGDANQGISGATNDAVVRSTGDWIAFLDCDDMLAPEAIERVVQHAKANPELRFVYTNRVDVDEDDQPVREWDFVNRTFGDPAEELLKGMFVSHLKVAHREAIAKAGLVRRRYDLSQDYDHVLRLSEVARFGFVREPLYRHRVHRRQSTQQHLELQERRAAEAKAAAVLRRDVEAGRFATPVSVVILSLNRLPDTRRCLEALERHTRVPYELVLVDNASDAPAREWLRANLVGRPRTKVVFSDVNLGCAGGRKEGLRHATGELVVTLDNDIEVTQGWLGHLLCRLYEAPDVAGACCRVVFPDGTLQFAGGTFAEDDGFARFGLLANGRRIEDLSTLYETECGWIPGGATVFRREVYDRIEFSDGLRGAYEDNHFSLAVRRAGWRLVNAPLATVWHHHVVQNREAAKDRKYMAARYDQGRIWEAMLEFYRLNGLVLEDPDVWRQLKLPADREEVRRIVRAEAGPSRPAAARRLGTEAL
jgi:GT2 family glycosyltransferase/SAM-dependent methyltransferase